MPPDPILPEPPADTAPSFVSKLTEAFSDRSGARVFNPLQVGPYVLSIQASAAHRWCLPQAAVAPEQVLAWEVMVTDV